MKHHKSLDSGLGYPSDGSFCHFSDIIFRSCVGLCQWVSACLSVTGRVGGLGRQKLSGAESDLLSGSCIQDGERQRQLQAKFHPSKLQLRKCSLSVACICCIFCLFVPPENLIKMARLLRIFPSKFCQTPGTALMMNTIQVQWHDVGKQSG